MRRNGVRRVGCEHCASRPGEQVPALPGIALFQVRINADAETLNTLIGGVQKRGSPDSAFLPPLRI